MQASWLGYLSTSGMTRVDYRITDVHADPPELADRTHTEKLLRLPHSQWCYRPPAAAEQAARAAATPPCERNGFVTFGSFNQAAKLSPTTRRLWAEILKRTPGSRLLVVGMPPGPATQALLDEFERNGVARGAVSVEPRLLLADYFRKLREVDVALDAMPYSGGTTHLRHPLDGRAGHHAARLAVGVAQRGEHPCRARPRRLDRDLAGGLRGPRRRSGERPGPDRPVPQGLRERMRASPLMDEARFARDMEALYRQMWRTWCTDCEYIVKVASPD